MKCIKTSSKLMMSKPRRTHINVAIGLIGCLSLAPFTSGYAASEYGYEASGNVIRDDVLYRIGGGSAVTMGRANEMQSIGVGVGWNTNLICGNMDLTTTLQNQLNGATSGFQTIMGSLIQNATSAVASLPALIIQRSNPALYNLLTNGVLQARVDYDRSKLNCRAMAEKMADVAGSQMGWGKLAEGRSMAVALASNQDAVAATQQAEENTGNEGITWVGGQDAGGSGQEPIRLIRDITKAGYNQLNRRDVTDNSSIGEADCDSGLICSVWASPDEVAKFANRVLGEKSSMTCQDCEKIQATPGVGLMPLIQEEYEKKLDKLRDLISGKSPTTTANLSAASSNSLPITRGVIEALRDEEDQEVMARRLASEVAFTSILEQALLLLRTIFSGLKEPNVAANDLAQSEMKKETEALQQEVNNLKAELELRRDLAANTATAIIEREKIRGEASRGIFQGDPIPNRLEKIQKSTPSSSAEK